MSQDLHRPLLTPDIIVNALSSDPHRPCIQLHEGAMLTVGEVRDECCRYVQALASLGVEPGTKVGMISPNRPEVLHVAHALQLLGAVYVTMHPMGSLADHLHVVRDSGMDLLVFDAAAYGPRADALREERGELRLASFGNHSGSAELVALAESFAPQPLVAPRLSPEAPVRMGYSGGTTGKPKALSSNQRTAAETLRIMMAEWEWPAPPRTLCCTPLSHAGAALFLPTLLKQGTMVVLPGFEAGAVLKAIEDYRINCIMLVPTMIYALLDHPDLDRRDLSSLETVFYGASAIAPARLKEAIERIGPVFSQFYGQAEAPMGITMLRKAEHYTSNPERLASCGRPLPWVHVELQDGAGNRVPDGEPGEVCVRGPLVMDGYRDMPELTAETLRGGWLHTGDVAVRDSEGFLRIVDRTKDMIVSGGFNIYPREIEDIVAEDPDVAQVAVIGRPDAKWGEAVLAVIVPRPGSQPDLEAIRADVAARKGRFQAPKHFELVEAIPLTPLGKPDKKALRARFA